MSQEHELGRKLSRIWQLRRTMARESASPRSTPLGVCQVIHKDRRSHGRQDITFSITFVLTHRCARTARAKPTSGLKLLTERLIHRISSRLLYIGNNVGVGVERDRHRRVPE